MNNTLEYKNYLGSIEFSETDGLFFGKVMGVRSLISYEGFTAKELIEDFHQAIDDYLELCAERGEEPESAYPGSFKVKVSPELHKQAAIYAAAHQMSLNSLVEQVLKNSLIVQQD